MATNQKGSLFNRLTRLFRSGPVVKARTIGVPILNHCLRIFLDFRMFIIETEERETLSFNHFVGTDTSYR